MLKRIIGLLSLALLLMIGYGIKQSLYSPLQPNQPQTAANRPNITSPAPKATPTPPTKPSAQSKPPAQQQPSLKAKANTSSPHTPKAIVSVPTPVASGTNVSVADVGQVEQMVLALVNEDRAKNGLKPVTWDPTAAKAAMQHVQEEADNGYISHWGMDGAKPQLRYTRAGGLDAVDENESVTLWSQGGFSGVNKEQLYKIVAQHEASMLSEQAPNDGHRKNILDPHHTGLGVAIAVGKYGVAMAQEFTNHFAQLNPVPLTAASGTNITLSGKIFPGYQITGIYAVWEQLPQPMTKAELMQTDTYSDPPWSNLHFWAKPNGTNYYVTTPQGNIFAKNVKVDGQGYFSLSVPLTTSHALDYITVEIAADNNLNDRFYAGQFVIEH